MKKKILLFLYFVSFQLLFVVSIFGQTLEMPQGFRVQIYAEIHSARQMALADNGVVFVGTENGWGVRKKAIGEDLLKWLVCQKHIYKKYLMVLQLKIVWH